MRAPLAFALLSSACFSPSFSNGVPCSEDRQCPEGQVCASDDRCYDPDQVPDFDGGVPDCAANEVVCEGDVLVECDGDGNVAATTPCPLGCHETESRCNRLDPSNGLSSFFDVAADGPEIALVDGATIDTSTGEVVDGDGSPVDWPSTLVPAPEEGAALRVFTASSAAFGDVQVFGENAIAVVSDGDVQVMGDIVIAPGTGRMTDSAVCQVITEGPQASIGLGGGGFGTNGAKGGDEGTANGLPGGPANGTVALEPLRGGCSGGQGCLQCGIVLGQPPSVAGIGGGAIQISSGTEILIGGAITAHGGGATINDGGGSNHGMGGGAGGAILLEAPRVDLLVGGFVGANGGGGSCSVDNGTPGDNLGSPNGGTCLPANGNGGDGATIVRSARAGGSVADGSSGGGGGGGLGRITIRAENSTLNGGQSPNPVLLDVRRH